MKKLIDQLLKKIIEKLHASTRRVSRSRMENKLNGLEKIEAELLLEPITIINLTPAATLDPHPSEAIASRDQHYDISLNLTGRMNPQDLNRDNSKPLGTVTDTPGSSGRSKSGNFRVEIGSALSRGRNMDLFSGQFKSGGSASSILVDYESKNAVSYTVLYSLGRPSINGLPSRLTNRESDGKNAYIKRQNTPQLGQHQIISAPFSGFMGGGAWDHLVIQTNFGSAIFSNGVETDFTKAFEPSYMHFIDGKGVTEHDFRRAYLEAISFVFGKRLIEIGYSEFDAQNELVRRYSRSPYTVNVHEESRISPLSPINISSGYTVNEVVVSNLVELFLKSRDQLNLSVVIWNLWSARMLPLGKELVEYYAAIESLMNAWFKINLNHQKEVYVSENNFNLIVFPKIEEIKAHTGNKDGWDGVTKKMSGANFMTGGDKLKKFFDALGLRSGSVEIKILKERHSFAHGGSLSGSEAKRFVVIARAYEALFNRCVLAAVGFKGKYIDYSTTGFPERDLQEPLGGPNGDGKI